MKHVDYGHVLYVTPVFTAQQIDPESAQHRTLTTNIQTEVCFIQPKIITPKARTTVRQILNVHDVKLNMKIITVRHINFNIYPCYK